MTNPTSGKEIALTVLDYSQQKDADDKPTHIRCTAQLFVDKTGVFLSIVAKKQWFAIEIQNALKLLKLFEADLMQNYADLTEIEQEIATNGL